jgi:glycosyltransferase involved in cell wall biosynthesis
VVQSWIEGNDYSCTFIRHEKNLGICATLNEALKMAKGKYFSAIGDDIMMPDKLEEDIAILEDNVDAAFCYSKMIVRYVNQGLDTYGDYKGSSDLFHDYLLGKVTIATPTVTYRIAVFGEVGFYDESLLFEDYDMYLRILYRRKAVFSDRYSVIYIRFGASIQSDREVEILNEFLNILDRWKFLPKYKYYKNNRHLFTFCQLSTKNKKEAVKHLLPAMTMFWQPRLYKNILKLIFSR